MPQPSAQTGNAGEELCFLPATVLRERIARRELSPVEVTRAVLERAERLQRVLNCFITICRDEALRQAQAAERALLQGGACGVLHGVPFTVKDIVNTAGVRTTFGSKLYENNVPAEDAEAVARLRRAGAILIGKTTTPEFGAKSLTDAPLFGLYAQCLERGAHERRFERRRRGRGRRRHRAHRGRDGRWRVDAHSGRLQWRRRPQADEWRHPAQPGGGRLRQLHFRHADDADRRRHRPHAAGHGGGGRERPLVYGLPVSDYVAAAKAEGDLCGKRILFCAAPPGRPIAADVAAAFATALGRLRELGAELDEMDGRRFDIEPMWRAINHTTWLARFGPLAARDADKMSPSLLRQLASASQVSGVAYQEAMFARTALFRHVQSLLREHDFLVTPTLSRTALAIEQDLFGKITIDGKEFDDLRANWFPWTMPFNMTGHPAMSVNCGFGEGGLPIGLQIVGRFRGEAEVLRLGALLETVQGLLTRWPMIEG